MKELLDTLGDGERERDINIVAPPIDTHQRLSLRFGQGLSSLHAPAKGDRDVMGDEIHRSCNNVVIDETYGRCLNAE